MGWTLPDLLALPAGDYDALVAWVNGRDDEAED